MHAIYITNLVHKTWNENSRGTFSPHYTLLARSQEQTTQVTLMSHLFYSWPVTGCKSGVRAGFTHSLHGIPQAQYHLLLSAACLVRVLNLFPIVVVY